MPVQSGLAVAAKLEESSYSGDTPEFVTRIAEEIRASSGSDLPLSCFVQQVKLQLAAGKSVEELKEKWHRGSKNSAATQYQSSDCFKSWAMPD
ncbi:hypothetical protein [Rhizobium sp. BK251]|uniref:hypothetical protein n=1 Tax=Rhizobium sp. BK251 TaxID=2512125 RepID=UPI0010471C76|nr:hypothetical protein [Rhizobium sp. BK251]TCL74741.1 uncharacterized protein EKR [Rhizobium sp. BK251]